MANPHVDEHGIQFWHNEAGQLHREDGPAVLYADRTEYWYQHGKLHRLDGPAIAYEMFNYTEWYIDGKQYHDLNEYCNDAGITGSHKTLLLLKHSLCLIQ